MEVGIIKSEATLDYIMKILSQKQGLGMQLSNTMLTDSPTLALKKWQK